MTFSTTDFYLETSAVNYLVDRFGWNDGIVTKALQNTKGNIWYLSPVSFWEILLTSDPERREQIIFFCQHTFHEKLLGAPSELIMHYINEGCPLVEARYDFTSKLELAQTWSNLCQDKQKTFIFDHVKLKERTKIFQKLSKQLHKIIHRVVLDITIQDEELMHQLLIQHYYERIKGDLKYHDPEYHKVVKISILLIFYILCLEVDLDNLPYKEFWKKIKIKKPLNRLEYTMRNLQTLVFRGPFYQMAIMAYHQISLDQKSNRGLLLDCLHSIYLTYINVFITNDIHFKTLRDKGLHPNFGNILHVTEIEFTTQLRQLE